MKNIHYDDFTSCVELNDWALKHLEYNIINIEIYLDVLLVVEYGIGITLVEIYYNYE